MNELRSMREIVISMLSGDPDGCLAYLSRQLPNDAADLVDASEVLRGIAHELMLRDPGAFVAHKFRTPAAGVDSALYREAIEHVQRGDRGAARTTLSDLSLDELGLVATLAFRLREALAQLRTHPTILTTDSGV